VPAESARGCREGAHDVRRQLRRVGVPIVAHLPQRQPVRDGLLRHVRNEHVRLLARPGPVAEAGGAELLEHPAHLRQVAEQRLSRAEVVLLAESVRPGLRVVFPRARRGHMVPELLAPPLEDGRLDEAGQDDITFGAEVLHLVLAQLEVRHARLG